MTSTSRRTVHDLDENSRRVLQLVLQHGPIPRRDLTRLSGLSMPSLTRLTRPLVLEGYLEELEPEPTALGRPTQPLALRDGSALVLGVKVVPGALHAVVTGLRGKVRTTVVRPADTSSPATTVSALAALARELHTTDELFAVGVSLAGAVDPFGTVRSAVLLGWPKCNFSSQVTEATGLPCTTANDVDALTLAQHWVGLGRGTENLTVLTLGSGVGAGAVVGGTLAVGYEGFNGMVGDLWCRDGRSYHEVLSTAGIVQRASAAAGKSLTVDDLRMGLEPLAEPVLADAARVLADLVILARHTWGPERIVLSGEGIWLLERHWNQFQESLDWRALHDVDPPEILVKQLEFTDWARGAAGLAIRLLLEP